MTHKDKRQMARDKIDGALDTYIASDETLNESEKDVATQLKDGVLDVVFGIWDALDRIAKRL